MPKLKKGKRLLRGLIESSETLAKKHKSSSGDIISKKINRAVNKVDNLKVGEEGLTSFKNVLSKDMKLDGRTKEVKELVSSFKEHGPERARNRLISMVESEGLDLKINKKNVTGGGKLPGGVGNIDRMSLEKKKKALSELEKKTKNNNRVNDDVAKKIEERVSASKREFFNPTSEEIDTIANSRVNKMLESGELNLDDLNGLQKSDLVDSYSNRIRKDVGSLEVNDGVLGVAGDVQLGKHDAIIGNNASSGFRNNLIESSYSGANQRNATKQVLDRNSSLTDYDVNKAYKQYSTELIDKGMSQRDISGLVGTSSFDKELMSRSKALADKDAQSFKETLSSAAGDSRVKQHVLDVNEEQFSMIDRALKSNDQETIRKAGEAMGLSGDDLTNLERASSGERVNQGRNFMKDRIENTNMGDTMGAYKVPQKAAFFGGTAWLVSNMSNSKGQQSNAQLYGQQTPYGGGGGQF